MAGKDCFASAADVEGCASTPSCKEGPVLTRINKRLRALKKKYNRIAQIEESKAQGKQINKEQEEVLKAKVAVGVLIEEFEKLGQAVKEEVEKELMESRGEGESGRATGEEEDAEVRKDLEAQAVSSETLQSENPNPDFDNVEPVDASEHQTEAPQPLGVPSYHDIGDLLHLLYFALLFDVPQTEATSSLVWTKVHERSSCVSYDCVTEEDSTSPLEERDLNDLSLLGSLIFSRPPNATLSHREALQQCIQHALLWLRNSDSPIREDLSLTYSHLRERLNRILSSEYYTMIPELQTVSQQSAAIAATVTGHYVPQLLVREASGVDGALESEDPSVHYSNQDPAQELLLQTGEQYTAPLPMKDVILETSGSHLAMYSVAPYAPETNVVDEMDQVVTDAAGAGPLPSQEEELQDQQISLSIEPLQGKGRQEPQEQQQESEVSNVSVGPRGYQGAKGGVSPGHNYGTGGRGRGYTNGRGGYGNGRGGGRGGYGNGRGAQYYDQRGYHPRNQYGRGGGRGMRRGGGSMFDAYANGQSNRA